MNLAQRIGSEIKSIRLENQSKASINAPAFNGSPTAATPADGDISNKVATTAFVNSAVNNTLGLISNCGNITISANASTANKLATPRLISLSGDVGGSVYFDGSQNVNINATIADNSHKHRISNISGLQEAIDLKADNTILSNCYPMLGVDGKIPNQFLNNSVSSGICIYNNLAARPVSGDLEKIYFDRTTFEMFSWSGSAYSKVNNFIKTINCNTPLSNGNLSIDKSTIGLSSVKNIDTTNASNISCGTLSVSYGGTGTNSQTGTGSIVKQVSPTLETPNIGVATGVSFNSITGLSSTVPLPATQLGSVGTSTLAARADHTHPVTVTDISGNSGSTTSLLTPRNFRIGTANRVFNGTQDVIWTLDDIGMANKIHNHTISDINGLSSCLSGKQNCYPILTSIALNSSSAGVLKFDGNNNAYIDNNEYLTSFTMKDYICGNNGINVSYDSSTCKTIICGLTASCSINGMMCYVDKIKLDGLSNYVHPYGLNNYHIPGGTESDNGKFLSRSPGGQPYWTSVPAALVTSVAGKTGAIVICESDISGLTDRVDSKITKNQSIVASTGTKITYDTNGLVTSSSFLVASDIPSLNANKITTGTIDIDRLPSEVNDVFEYNNYLSFPTTGLAQKIYIDKSNNTQYRWNGTTYVGFASSGSVSSINGKVGSVIITKSEIIGIENIDNTSDINKPLSIATQNALSLKANTSSLHCVAFSGEYNCLRNKPTIPVVPTNISSFTNDSGYLKHTNISTINGNTITSGGDLCIATSSSWMDMDSKPTTILGYGITDAYTKTEIDAIAVEKQNTLISGTSIKTINGCNILTSGNLNLLTCVSWNDVCYKPTTILGYGITDSYTKDSLYNKTEIDSCITSLNSLIGTKVSQSYVDNRITCLIGLAPAALDTIEELASKLLEEEGSIGALTSSISSKVDKVEGKVLSSNDFTNAEKIKLSELNNYTLPTASISSIGGIKLGNGFNVDVSGTLTYSGQTTIDWNTLCSMPNTVAGYGITDVYTKTESISNFEPKNVNIQSHISSVGNVHGLTKADLSLENVANIAPIDMPLSTATTTALASKQNTLVSGSTIKTVNGISLLGTGNISTEPEFSSILNKPNTISGYGIVDAQQILVSGVDIKTLNGSSLLGGGNISIDSTWIGLSGKPTTIAGYGITDAYVKTEIDTKFANALINTTNELILKANNQDVYDKAYIDELFNIIEW